MHVISAVSIRTAFDSSPLHPFDDDPRDFFRDAHEQYSDRN